jgi:hypothetical protein
MAIYEDGEYIGEYKHPNLGVVLIIPRPEKL